MSRSLAEDTSNRTARLEPGPTSQQRLVVRAIACWTTREQFIQHETKCFIRGHLSLLHATPPEIGSGVHFEVRLASGAIALKGTGVVVEAAPRGLIPVGRLSQAGARSLVVRVEQVTASTKQLLRELLTACATARRTRERGEPAARTVIPPPDRDALLQRLRERQAPRS